MTSRIRPIADMSGRPLGSRALKKRRLLLDATKKLLEESSLRDLRVADIARAVSTSPATFYQYFGDVEDAVLQLSAEANEEMPALLQLFDGSWRGKEGLRRAREIVLFFIQYWDAHGAVLRVRNLAADEGDVRFMELRRLAMEPVLAAMTAQMESNTTAKKDSGIKPLPAGLVYRRSGKRCWLRFCKRSAISSPAKPRLDKPTSPAHQRHRSSSPPTSTFLRLSF